MSHTSTKVGGMTAYELKVDAKRRPTLPTQLLVEVEIEHVAGTTLVARPLGRGRFLVETQEAAQQERRAELRAGFAPQQEGDATADVRAWRAEDAALLGRAAGEVASPNEAGQALLTLLGLE
jgi:hypothetical protein